MYLAGSVLIILLVFCALVFFYICLRSVSRVQCFMCLSISPFLVRLPIQFSPTFIKKGIHNIKKIHFLTVNLIFGTVDKNSESSQSPSQDTYINDT
jgi:hypothetical protein